MYYIYACMSPFWLTIICSYIAIADNSTAMACICMHIHACMHACSSSSHIYMYITYG